MIREKRFLIALIAIFVSAFFVYLLARPLFNVQAAAQAAAYELKGYDLEDEYSLGQSVYISDAHFVVGANNIDANYKVILPSGKTSTQSELSLGESGDYKVVYTAEKNGTSYCAVKKFRVVGDVYSYGNGLGTAVYEVNPATTSGASGLTVTLPEGVSFNWNKVIDLSKNTPDDVFLKLYFLPETIGTADYLQFIITLTDVYDDENKITITVQSSRFTSGNGYVSAAANDQIRVGLENGLVHRSGNFGFLTHCSFFGKPEGGKSLEAAALTLMFDYENLRLLGVPGFENHDSMITDFDNPTLYSDLWHGFKTGEVKMSMTCESYSASQATFVVLDINGEDLSGTRFVDGDIPDVEIDRDGYEDVPVAQVNSPYPLFKAESYDSYFGNLETRTEIYYNYQKEGQKQFPVINGSFIPTMVGRYTAVYSAVDGYGNKALKTYNIDCIEKVPDISVTLTENDEYLIVDGEGVYDIYGKVVGGNVGRKVYLPDYYVEGGSGRLTVVITTVNSETGKEEIVKDGWFIPRTKGVYTVTFTVKDYLSSVVEKTYTVNVGDSVGPIFEDDNLPVTRIFNGKQTILPKLIAYDYVAGEKVYADVELSCYIGNEAIPVDGFSIKTNARGGDELTAVYTAYGPYGETVKKFNISIAEPSSSKITMSDYFVSSDVTVNVGSDCTVVTANDDNASFEWFTTLAAENFDMSFSGKTVDFEKLNIYLTDSKNYRQQVKISFITGEKATVTINDGEVMKLENMSFVSGADSVFSFKVYNLAKSIEIANGSSRILTSINYYLSGEEFKGFESGLINMKVEFDGVRSSSSINLYTICGQPVKNLSYDILKPRITLTAPVVYYQTEKNKVMQTVKAVSADVLDLYVDFSMTAYAPGGKVLTDIYGKSLQNVDPSRIYSFKLNTFGNYIFVYTAEDWAGNEATLTYSVTLYDTEGPKIVLDGQVISEARVGDDIVIPDAIVKDNVSESLVYYVYVKTPDNLVVKINHTKYGSFKVADAGVYTLIYVSYDNEGNMTQAEYKINVS